MSKERNPDQVYLRDFMLAVEELSTDELNAAQYHDRVESILRAQGWRCWREYPAPYRRKKKGLECLGAIDLFAIRGGRRWAIELDCSQPRAKSIDKLSNLDVDLRIVILRRPKLSASRWTFCVHKGYWRNVFPGNAHELRAPLHSKSSEHQLSNDDESCGSSFS